MVTEQSMSGSFIAHLRGKYGYLATEANSIHLRWLGSLRGTPLAHLRYNNEGNSYNNERESEWNSIHTEFVSVRGEFVFTHGVGKSYM